MKTIASIFCICVLSCAASATDDHAQLTALQNQIARLEMDVHAAEAIRSIKRLQHAYGHYAEFGLWNDLADLFSENGIGHYPAGNLGKEAIRKLFLQDVGKGKLGLAEGQFYPHVMLQPVITLAPDLKKARGRWRVLAMLGSYGGSAIWAGGVYENEYILGNGVWKINDLHYYSKFTGRYEQSGWTVDKEASPIHYDPERAGTPIPKNSNPSFVADTKPALKTLSSRLTDLIRRTQLLNDEAEVENLQRIYGYYIDRYLSSPLFLLS